ncbi:MAG TPA: site-specific DNA-methyltransferase [Candidatus Acidoferrales bacterium]|nr:site-specific DNA-methyltransferase [Candidatus Acidoferrales bacterium]
MSATLFQGDRLDLIREIPDSAARLIVTSPPYNIGKKYERRVRFDEYLKSQRDTLKECARILAIDGSLCWQVGNHIGKGGEVFPLDMFIYRICKRLGLKLRNRIVWCFEHGLHCRSRLSGRYETVLWFTKGDDYVFNLDAIRVPQKYPGKKYFKGARIGQYSCNPLGKNPSDVWTIPNVKHNHVEKTAHPCQFPIELVERLVLALTNPNDLVVDPYIGVASAACAAVLHNRRAAGAEVVSEYVRIGRERVKHAIEGRLRRRPLGRPVYQPGPDDKIAQRPSQPRSEEAQMTLSV